jgi:hypothetical protein
MVTLALTAAFLAAVYLGKRAKLRLLAQHVLRSARRIYGVSEFRFYAVADGIKQLLYGSNRGLGPPVLQPGAQFLLFPFG